MELRLWKCMEVCFWLWGDVGVVVGGGGGMLQGVLVLVAHDVVGAVLLWTFL
jgi:hypothetical protein